MQDSKNKKVKTKTTKKKEEIDWSNVGELTYTDIEPIVEYLVRVKATENTFDCYDIDDIAQEIRIICWTALETFSADRAKSYKQVVNYFGRCVDTRLQNVKRDNYIRFSPPFSKAELREISDNPDEHPEKLEKLTKFKDGIREQQKIKNPTNIENIGHNEAVDVVVGGSLEAEEMRNQLVEGIDDDLREPLINMMNGDKRKVKIEVREQVRASVRFLLDE